MEFQLSEAVNEGRIMDACKVKVGRCLVSFCGEV